MDISITVNPEPLSKASASDGLSQELFGSLLVNGRHIWRFDTVGDANAAARNLRLALEELVPVSSTKVGK